VADTITHHFPGVPVAIPGCGSATRWPARTGILDSAVFTGILIDIEGTITGIGNVTIELQGTNNADRLIGTSFNDCGSRSNPSRIPGFCRS